MTYCNAARGGPSHSHGDSAQQISWRSFQRFQRYAGGHTDTHTDRQTKWLQYSAPLPGRTNYSLTNEPTQLSCDKPAINFSYHSVILFHSVVSQFRSAELFNCYWIVLKNDTKILPKSSKIVTPQYNRVCYSLLYCGNTLKIEKISYFFVPGQCV